MPKAGRRSPSGEASESWLDAPPSPLPSNTMTRYLRTPASRPGGEAGPALEAADDDQGDYFPTPTPTATMENRVPSFGIETTDAEGVVDLTEPPPPLVEAIDEHLKDFEDDLPVVKESEDEGHILDPEEYHRHEAHWEQSASAYHSDEETESGSALPRSQHKRSASLPSRPLKSALAMSPPRSPPEYRRARKKRARFQDDPSSSDLSLRRTSTAPAELRPVSTPGVALHPQTTYFETYDDEGSPERARWRDSDEVQPTYEPERLVVEVQTTVSDEDADDPLEAEADDAEAEAAEDSASARGEEEEDVEPRLEDEDGERSETDGHTETADNRLERAFDDNDNQGTGNDDREVPDSPIERDADSNSEDDNASATEDGNSQDDRLFLTPENHSDSEIQLLLVTQGKPAPNTSEDDGPISLPADEQLSSPTTDDLELLMPVISETEPLVLAPRPIRPRPASQPVHNSYHRRMSDSEAGGRGGSSEGQPAASVRRRASSMNDFHGLRGRLKLRSFVSKASPADCAITACSVRAAESPRLHTVYEHPAARHRQEYGWQEDMTRTAQTVTSAAGTFQVVWEEPAADSESVTTLIEDPPTLEVPEDDDSVLAHVDRSPSPMGKVKTKLAAWSWAREMDEEGNGDGESRSIPLMSLNDDDVWRGGQASVQSQEMDVEDPPAPPNTERQSATSSARHSGPQTPYEPEPETIAEEDADIDLNADVNVEEEPYEPDDEAPIELQFKSAFARNRSMSAPAFATNESSYLAVPGSRPASPSPRTHSPQPHSRILSNLSTEEADKFKSHRDSVDLYHRKVSEERMNHMLMNTRDSFVLAKSKYDSRFPRLATGAGGSVSSSAAGGGGSQHIHWSRFGGLSPILDASPPDGRGQVGVRGMSKLSRNMKAAAAAEEEDGQCLANQEQDVELEEVRSARPKWFKALYMRGEDGSLTLKLLDEEA